MDSVSVHSPRLASADQRTLNPDSWPETSVAVSECGCSSLPVCRQAAPCAVCGHSHEGRCLLCHHLLYQ